MAESGQAFGGPGEGVVVVVVGRGLADVLGDALGDASPSLLGGLDGGFEGAVEAGGTPFGRTFAAPRTEGGPLPSSSAPIAHTNNTAPTPRPAMASMRRRRYTDGDSGPLGSFTSGN
jgi:hypothetical protein